MKSNPGRYWSVVCLALTGVLMVPILAVAWSLTQDSDGVWGHLAETVLGNYVSNTILLTVGVGCGTLLIGVGAAWLVTSFSFPGVGFFRWALLIGSIGVIAVGLGREFAAGLSEAGAAETLRGILNVFSALVTEESLYRNHNSLANFASYIYYRSKVNWYVCPFVVYT